jgi:hypothetical protein
MSHLNGNSPESACEGKDKFASKPDAERVANRRRKKRSGAMRARAYRCPYCDHWHIGHDRPGKR